MKKLWVIPMMVFLLLPEAAQAQSYPVDRGSWIIGGSASFISQGTSDDDGRITTVLVNPNAQFFALPGLAVGGVVSLSYTSQAFISTTGFGIGPAVSYYFGRGQRKVYPFISASVSINDLSIDADEAEFDANLDQTVTSTAVAVSGGVALMVAKNVGLTGELFYRQENFRTDDGGELFFNDDFEADTVGLRFGLAAFVF